MKTGVVLVRGRDKKRIDSNTTKGFFQILRAVVLNILKDITREQLTVK